MPITIGQDDGRVIQVVSGLTPDAEVIQNPPDSILDGEQVHIVKPSAQAQSGPQAGTQGGGGNGKTSGAEGAQQQTGSQQSGSQANDANASKSNSGGGKQ